MPHAPHSPCMTVSFYAVCNDKVLMIHHKKMNRWLCPGGHVDPGENPYQALLREVQEETGLDDVHVLGHRGYFHEKGVDILPAPTFMDEHDTYAGYRHVGMVYFLQVFSDEIVLNEDEHNEIKWFTKEEMYDPRYNFPSNVVFYAEMALKFVEEFVS